MKRLENKTALVTGGSRGMGAAIAKRLAQEGAKVAITYVSAADKAQAVVKEIEAAGGQAIAIAADNQNAEALTAAVNQAAKTFGSIDILVNNAGIWIDGQIDKHTLAEFDRVVSVNVRAVFVAVQAALAHMPNGGRIITIGSNLGERVWAPGMTLYSMTKAALIGFTKGLARDLGAREITVNLIQPGSTDTDMNPQNGPHSDHQRALMAIPKYGSADDIAAYVAFLSGTEARSFTGAVTTIDGGLNA